MASNGRNFSLLPTLLLSLVIGVIVGVLLLLLFGRHVGNTDTVSAVNSGLPGTNVVSRAPTATTAPNTAQTQNSQAQGTQTQGSQAQGNQAQNNQTQNSQAQNNQAQGNTNAGLPTANGGANGMASGTNAQAGGQTSAASGVPNSAPSASSTVSTGSVNDTATSQSGTGIESEKSAVPLSATVVGDQFTGTGEQIYVQACQSCHQAGGVGAKGAGIYPALANNPRLKVAAYPETMVLFGNGGMPGFGHYMNDEQVAAVVNYVRTELNKNTDKVTPQDIKNLRPTKPDYMIFGEAAG